MFESKNKRKIKVKEVNKNDSIIAFAEQSIVNPKTVAPLTKANMEKLYNEFDSIKQIDLLSQISEATGVKTRLTEFYAVFGGLKKYESEDFQKQVGLEEHNESEEHNDGTQANLDKDKETILKEFRRGDYRDSVIAGVKKGVSADAVVLIIDEINRGNISQIFGELITLIEEDKRLGNPEAIEVQLPYSKEKFSVPPNLYIIGTMNTADRSIEALDTALRRRFSFHEMTADPEIFTKEGKISQLEMPGIVEGVNVVKMLKTINQRIEKLIDKDHQIGHSYFMDVTSKGELEAVFKNKVIPLLEEYFFGDFGKIGLVLGDSFVQEQLMSKSFQFATFNGYDSSLVNDLKERKVYRIKPSGWDFNSIYGDKTTENDATSGD